MVFGIGVRKDAARADLLAACENDSGGPAALDGDPLDRRLGPDRGAGLARGVGHRLGQAADASPHEAPLPDAAAGLLRGVVVEEHVGGARCGRARGRVVDRVPAERREDLLGLEPLAQVLGCGRPEQEGRVRDQRPVARRHPAQLREPRELAGTHVARVRGSRVDERRDQAGDARELLLEGGESTRVRRGELLELALGGAQVVVEEERRAVGPQVQRRPGGIDSDPALDQAKVAPDGLAQHAEDVGAGRGMKARRELLGHRAAADDLAALQDHRLEARAREVVGRDQAVVAAADDRDIPGLGDPAALMTRAA